MSSTTSFEDWLEENDPEGHEELYALYQAVENRESYGPFEIVTKEQTTFVTGHASTLILASPSARSAFLKRVDALKNDDELDMESWYGFQRNMANPKA